MYKSKQELVHYIGWLEDQVSQDEYRLEMFENGKAYHSECKSYMRPIVTRKYDSSWNMFDRHTYPGGACRIHMLRQILGEAAFWTGVQTYVERFSGKTVQTTDFQTALEESSGLNLTRFFDEFIYSKGYPQVKGQYEFKDDRVKISMTQTQVNAEKEIPLFAFDLDIEVVDDKNQVHNTTITFDREASVSAFIPLEKGSKPVSVRVDPEGKVPLYTLDMSVDRQILIEVAKNGKDIVNRIWAYSELIKDGSRPALKAVREGLANEPFYGVRVHGKKKKKERNILFLVLKINFLLFQLPRHLLL
jgi:aminopeptidase N